MKKYHLLTLLLFILTIVAPAQILFHSHGTLPASLIGKPEDRAKKKIEERKQQSDLVDQTESNFIYLTEYSFANFANSGKLSTGDTLCKYAERILDKLLVKDPKLRKKITVFTLHSTEVNAFMMGNGALLLSTGMLAHIQNEAQLAFILSHEVVHFREHHNLQSFRNRQRAENAYFNPLASVLRFSRELELEADEEGVKIFRAAGYALHEGYAALQILDHHDWSFGQVPMYPSFFEHGDYKFPKSYTLNKIKEIEKSDVERDESRSTHPGLDKRLRVIAPLLGDTSMRVPLYQISEPSFNYLQDVCRREVINLYLEERNYPEAIYGAYVLLQQDSTDLFAREVIGKALYNLAIYYSESEFYTIPKIFVYEQNELFENKGNDEPDYKMQGPEDVPGECQRLVYFFHQLYGFELTVLALDWNWQLNISSGFEEKTNTRCDHLMELIKTWHNLQPHDFSDTSFYPSDNWPTDDYTRMSDITNQKIPKFSTQLITKNIKEKYKDKKFYSLEEYWDFQKQLNNEIEDSINIRKREQLHDRALLIPYLGNYTKGDSLTVNDSVYLYYRYAFVDYMQMNDEFKLNFIDALESKRSNPYENFDVTFRSNTDRYSDYGLGSTRIAVLNPEFYWLGEIKRTMEFDYDASKSAAISEQQTRALQSAAKSSQLEMLYLMPERMDSLDSTAYTTYCMLKSWLNERRDLGGNSFTKNMAYSSLGDTLAKRLGTPYVMLSYATTKHVKRIRKPPLYVFGLLVPVMNIPVLIYGLIPNNTTRYTTIIYDLRSGEMAMLFQEINKGKGSEYSITQHYNNVFKKVKQPKE